MATTVVERTVSDGRVAKVEIVGTGAFAKATAYVGGQDVGGEHRAINLRKPVMVGGQCYTHYVGKLALTAIEAERVNAALDAASRVRTPRPEDDPTWRPANLRARRRWIVEKIADLRDAQDAEFERRHAREDETAWSAKRANDGRIAALTEELRQFDVAHPAIIEAIRAERAAKQAEALRRDQYN